MPTFAEVSRLYSLSMQLFGWTDGVLVPGRSAINLRRCDAGPSALSTGFDHFLDRLATDAEFAGDVGLADTVFDEGKH
jgi:hypothetical protein